MQTLVVHDDNSFDAVKQDVHDFLLSDEYLFIKKVEEIADEKTVIVTYMPRRLLQMYVPAKLV
ncbi:hypothetical protein OZX56_05340 [Lactobacillus sp. ESL0684]|uniref:hypothetical protein n=1 Tax=Lactobacillus sp. ESL0684 TaxID=2983213 RepID=UPI0023F83BE6|nr:hypothetical protein [Lactobacillus sp. ESL0684]WEV42973.1 hypothetical protein OZX56_05340 [Lactobacillus sp. ESL0684]